MTKVQGTGGKTKNDLIGISFYEKEPIKPADMCDPVDRDDDNELEWRDRCERADRKADEEILYHMRSNSVKAYGFGRRFASQKYADAWRKLWEKKERK